MPKTELPAELISQLNRHNLPTDHCVFVGQAAKLTDLRENAVHYFGSLQGLAFIDGFLTIFFYTGGHIFSLFSTEVPTEWLVVNYCPEEDGGKKEGDKEDSDNYESYRCRLEIF